MFRIVKKRVRRAFSVVRPAAATVDTSVRGRNAQRGFERLEPRLVLDAGPLVISEFLAANDSGLTDEDGDFSDWIEIYNPTDTVESLDGWYLTDAQGTPDKWRFPDVMIQPGEFRTVFASNKDRSDPAGELHTNFSLDADGEYLALVRPDGVTASHEFAPKYPRQVDDISYGLAREYLPLVTADTEMRYRVPTAADAAVAETWTERDFDDATWTGGDAQPTIAITEAGNGAPDYVEIQNVSDQTVDTSGWVLALNRPNDPAVGDAHYNGLHTPWDLPASMAPGEIVLVTDLPPSLSRPNSNYFGENIFWGTGGEGWAMIVRQDGHVADFVPWGYGEAELADMSVTIGGQEIRGSSAFSSGGVPTPVDVGMTTVQRVGNVDHDNSTDFVFVEPDPLNRGVTNPDLVLPLSAERMAGVGFSTMPGAYGGMPAGDLGREMYGQNSSVWARIPFQVDDLANLGTLTLKMRYCDGFAAYVNGQPVVASNAPENLEWDAHATVRRTVAQANEFRSFGITPGIEHLVEGTNVLAIHGLNVSADDGDFLLMARLDAMGVEMPQRYFDTPTPGRPNEGAYLGYAGDTKFSVDRGFFDEPFNVAISSDTPGATIRYTLDGSTPTADHGTEYTEPIPIAGTTTLRAVALKEDLRPSNVDTQTYLFVDDVIRQSPNGEKPGPDWPAATTTGQWIDYGMDPDIVDSETWGPQMREAMTSIPSLSMVTDLDNLFSPSNGIYVNAGQEGRQWERPVSLELLYPPDASGPGFPDGADEGFQIDAGARIRGGWSVADRNPKHAFRLFFRDVYGDAKLEYPLFGKEGVDKFDHVDLRTAQDFSWSFLGNQTNTMLREVFSRDAQRDAGQPYTRSRYYHLYINGHYWGLYQTQERSEAFFAESYLGGDESEYDVVKQRSVLSSPPNTVYATDGNFDAFTRLFNAAMAGFATDEAYYGIQGLDPVTHQPDPEKYERLVDVDNLTDYMACVLATGDRDSPIYRNSVVNNVYGIYNRENPDGWKWFRHDAEMSLDQGVRDRTGPYTHANFNQVQYFNPQILHQKLVAHPDYRMRFADRIFERYFNGGIFDSATAKAAIDARAEQIEMAIIAESARWGDAKTSPPLTKNTWLGAINTTKSWWDNAFGAGPRSLDVIRYLKEDGWYPTLDPPTYNQRGGRVPQGFVVDISGPGTGTVYYTLDGSDPRLPGGEVSPSAIVLEQGGGDDIVLTEGTLIKARTLSDTTWSVLNEAYFTVYRPADAATLAITEINYNPRSADTTQGEPEVDNDAFEFVELTNISDETLDLTGVRFTEGIAFNFTTGDNSVLAPGARVLLVGNIEAFESRYGQGLNVAGQYGDETRLSNGGERILLVDRFGGPILDFEYDDSGKWPGRADGSGSSLEVVDTAGDYNDADNWRSSSEYGGSPGVEGVGPIHDVIVNEVLSHSGLDGMDRIELLNTSDHAVDLSGWYLSDSNDNFQKYRIPEGTILTAGAYRVFDEDDFNPSGGLDPEQHPGDFALNGPHGDDVWLLAADATGRLTHFIDHAEFPAAALGETFGRWPNGTGRLVPMRESTIGDENTGPRVGPIVLSEVHYNAVDADPNDTVSGSDLEFVELYNPTGAAVDLTGWRIRGGIDFEFTDGTMLPSQGTLVVVPFELFDTTRLAQFRADYGIDASVALVGGYRNKLDNGGDRVQLQRPSISPPDEPDYTPHLVEDEVIYDDLPPWPIEADGQGMSLHRTSIDAWGHAATSWVAQAPTPGEAVFSRTSADFDGDGDMDVDDIDALTLVGNLAVGVAVPEADAKFDLNTDGIVNTADLDQWLAVAAIFNGFGSSYLRGDANLDGDVDIWAADGSGDAQVLNSNLGTNSDMAWSNGDFNGDGDVDIMQLDGMGDAQWLSGNMGKTLEAAVKKSVDAILQQTPAELTSAKVDWLYEFEQMTARRERRRVGDG